jgi:lysophospholipase L1-like esterase
MRVSKKSFFLALFVAIELSILTLLLSWVYQRILEKKKVLGATVIHKEDIIFPEQSEFRYYSLLKPNTVVEEQPNWLPYKAVSTYNNDGLNDRFDYQVKKPVDTFRIIALGDSFTYGEYVNTADSWPEQLEELLKNSPVCKSKKFEVINLGVHGFDIPYTVKRYEEVGAKYQPDLIIWFESGTGFSRINEVESTITFACQKKEQVMKVPTNLDCWTQGKNALKERYTDAQVTTYLSKYMARFFTTVPQTPVMFVTFSNLPESNKAKLTEWIANKDHTTLLPIVPDISKQEGTLLDGHPNAKGHQVIAQTILQKLTEKYCQ